MSQALLTEAGDAPYVLRLPNRRSIRAARALDRMVGFSGTARPIAMVSGFWRSGTTWMQELLAHGFRAKTVFEPLSPHHPARDRQLQEAGLLDEGPREAFIPGRAGPDDPLWPYLDASFIGATNSLVSMRCRHTVRESLRRAIIVKDVRLQVNLDAIHARYKVPVVHVRRHPCGVVSSLLSAKWRWSFDDVRLAEIVEPLLREPDAADLRGIMSRPEFDADAISRIAAYWAITERFADRALRGQPWAMIVGYEEAVLSPETTLPAIAKLIGRGPARPPLASVDSATTIASLRGTDVRLRPQAWRSRLSPADAERILDIVAAIFPDAAANARRETPAPSA